MSGHVQDRLGLFLDGEIPAEERASIAGHLRECAACARRLEELAAVDDVARSLSVEAPEGYFDTFPSRVRARLRAPAARRPFGPPAWFLAAAAVLVVGVLAPILWRETPRASLRQTAERAEPPAATPLPEAPAVAAPATTSLVPSQEQAPPPRPQAPAEEAKSKRRLKDVTATPAAEAKSADTLTALGYLGKKAEAAPAAEPPAKQDLEARRDAPALTAAPAGFAGAPADTREADAVDAQKAAPPARPAGAAMARTGGRGVAANAAAPGPPEMRYRALLASRPSTAAEARSLREAWRTFAESDPTGPHADEARVGQVEAAATAYRLSGDEADWDVLQRAAADYLARPGAPQAARVRALVESVKPQ